MPRAIAFGLLSLLLAGAALLLMWSEPDAGDSRRVAATTDATAHEARPSLATRVADPPAGGDEADDAAETESPGELAPWVHFRVLVLSAATDQPIPQARVERESGVLFGLTDEQGHWKTEFGSTSGMTVRIRKEGYLSLLRHIGLGEVQLLHLQPGVDLAGRVVAAGTGVPIPRAQVRAWDRDSMLEIDAVKSTDALGRFAFDAVRKDVPLDLVVCAPGRVPKTTRVVPGGPTRELTVSLEAGGTVEGIVRRWDGSPGAGLALHIVRSDASTAVPHPDAVSSLAHEFALPRDRTAPDGHYRIQGVASEIEFEVVVQLSEQFAARSAPFRIERAGEVVRRDIHAPAPASLLVTLTYGDGTKVEHAHVVLRDRFGHYDPPEGESSRAAWTFPEMTPGNYEVGVFVIGGRLTWHGVALLPGAHAERRITLGRGLALEGEVVGPAGKPVPKALVWWVSDGGDGFAQADEAGHFRFDGLQPSKGRLVIRESEAGAGEVPLADAYLDDVLPGGTSLRVILLPFGWIRGRIPALPAGTQVPGEVVSARSAGPACLTIGEHGAFELPVSVTEQPFLLVLRPSGLTPLLLDFDAVLPETSIDVGSVPLDPGFALAARVEDERGKPLHGARVGVAAMWGGADRTDSAGCLRLEHLPRRAFAVKVEHDSYPLHAFAVDGTAVPAAGEHAVVWVLGPGGRVEGRVRREAGEAVAGIGIRAVPTWESSYDPDHEQLCVETEADAEGRWHLRLQPGAWRILAEGWHKGEARVDVKARESVEVELPIR